MAPSFGLFGRERYYENTGDQYKIRNIYHCSLKASGHNTGNV